MTPSVWQITLAKADLIAAIGTARRRATLRRRGSGPGFEPWVILAAVSDALGGGLSIRSSDAAMDVPGEGRWPSPSRLGALLPDRRAADGQLAVGTPVLTAAGV